MRYLILLLLFFWALTSEAQKVCIDPDVARYFLEIDDEVRTRRKKDSLAQQQIQLLETKITLKDSLISSYQTDSISYQNLIGTKSREVTLYKDKYRQQKKTTRLTRIGAGVLIVLTIILMK